MVSGPYKPERPKPVTPVAPTYNNVLHREAPRADQELARRQFESALSKAGGLDGEKSSVQQPVKRSQSEKSSAPIPSSNTRSAGLLDSLAMPRHEPGLPAGLRQSDSRLASGRAPVSPVDNTTKRNSASQDSTSQDSANHDRAGKSVSSHTMTGKVENTVSGRARKSVESEARSQVAEEYVSTQPSLSGMNIVQGGQSNTARIDSKSDSGTAESLAIDSTANDSAINAGTVDSRPIDGAQKYQERDAQSDEAALSGLLGIPQAPDIQPPDGVAGASATGTQADRFATVELMWNHLSAMDARSGPKEWHFQIHDNDSPLVSIALSAGKTGGWVVTVASSAEGAAAAASCLLQLEEKFRLSGDKVDSVHLTKERLT